MNLVHRLSLLLLPLFSALPACAAEDVNEPSTDHAVVLVYHHVSEETPPSTSVSPEQFAAHLDFLAREGFNVWPLSRILEHLQNGRKLPARTVALTFDDAYRSVYTHALPMLRSRNFPFTIFVTTDYIDGKSRLYLSWEQLREMTSQGAEIGNHSLSHPPGAPQGWRKRGAVASARARRDPRRTAPAARRARPGTPVCLSLR